MDKIEFKIIVEADDHETQLALASCEMDDRFAIITVPTDGLKTKPKAMNYALPFCAGDIIGIYDAEDRPELNQLKHVASAFAAASDDTAAVQCELDFYNSRQNWLTRCFTIEYRIWFSHLLPAFEKYNLPIPLGGTSVFLRRTVLETLGKWDSYNVTEDADLGVRLKRFGYETIVIPSVTLEEANARPISWVRQRSRWLKGYLQSWGNHMRNPKRLLSELGWKGFMGVQILFLCSVGNYLAIPLFWMCWLGVWGVDVFGISQLPDWFRTSFMTIMIISMVTTMSLGALALSEKRFRHLIPSWILLPLYWPLGALAAYKAVVELIFWPSYWDKTSHDGGQLDRQYKNEL